MNLARVDIFKSSSDRPFILVRTSVGSNNEGTPYFAVKLAKSDSFAFIDPETSDFVKTSIVPSNSDGQIRCSECGEIMDNINIAFGVSLIYSDTGIIPHVRDENSPIDSHETVSHLCDTCEITIKAQYKQAIEGSEANFMSKII